MLNVGTQIALRSVNQIKQLYVVNDAELVAAAAQNVGLMQAGIFRQILATGAIERELLIAPPCARPR